MDAIVRFYNYSYDLRTKYCFKSDFIILMKLMINIGTRRRKMIVFNDQPKPAVYECGKLEHISLLFCVTTSGRFMKPLDLLVLIILE